MNNDRLPVLLEMLKETPEDAFLNYGIALEYQSRNDDENALVYFLRLKTKNTKYLPLYYQLGKLYERQNLMAAAIGTYAEGVGIAREQKDMHTLSELQNALDELT
jgi:tetratricopeptide (TPR) repeat protein